MRSIDFLPRLLDRLRALCEVEVDPDTALFESGLLNSMKFIELMAFVETTLGAPVPTNRLSAEYFSTPRTIAVTFCTG
jgi:acyl carrier protein